MERFPHLNPVCSQHRRYSNADGNCAKPHPPGTAEEVGEAVPESPVNPGKERDVFAIPVGNALLCLGLVCKI